MFSTCECQGYKNSTLEDTTLAKGLCHYCCTCTETQLLYCILCIVCSWGSFKGISKFHSQKIDKHQCLNFRLGNVVSCICRIVFVKCFHFVRLNKLTYCWGKYRNNIVFYSPAIRLSTPHTVNIRGVRKNQKEKKNPLRVLWLPLWVVNNTVWSDGFLLCLTRTVRLYIHFISHTYPRMRRHAGGI